MRCLLLCFRTLAEQALSQTKLIGSDVVKSIEAIIAQLDKKLTEQVNLILHHPDFQKLEGAWRGLLLPLLAVVALPTLVNIWVQTTWTGPKGGLVVIRLGRRFTFFRAVPPLVGRQRLRGKGR